MEVNAPAEKLLWILMQYVNWQPDCVMTPILGECLDYPEYLHLSNIYFLDISFADFFVHIDLTFKKFLLLKPDVFSQFVLPILALMVLIYWIELQLTDKIY